VLKLKKILEICHIPFSDHARCGNKDASIIVFAHIKGPWMTK